VFKEHVTKDEINKYADELEGAGTLSHSKTLSVRYTHNYQSAIGGQVTHRYDAVLNGFSASIPESFLNNFQGNDAVDYIGKTSYT
jgi:hypothetical protein